MKRIFVLLLCMLLCISMLPVSAFAEEAEFEFGNETEDEDIVELEIVQVEGHEHSLTYVPGKDPDCSGGQVAYYKCSGCDKIFYDEEGTREATKSDKGFLLPPKHVHPEVKTITTVTAATCTGRGTIKYRCAVCGNEVTESTKALGHDLIKHDYLAPTCTSDGNTTYYSCSRCSHLFEDAEAKREISKENTVILGGHHMTETPAHDATCLIVGNTRYYYCDVCGNYFADEAGAQEITLESTVVAALGHRLVKTEEKASTCVAEGNTEYWKCDRDGCGALFADEQGNTTVDLAAVTIPVATVHQLRRVDAVTPTCKDAGHAEYWECTVCGKLFSDESGENQTDLQSVALPISSEHVLSRVAEAVPSCTQEGHSEYWECGVCGKLFSDAAGMTEITTAQMAKPALQHTLTKTEAKAGSCSEDGNIAYWTCNACGKHFKDAAGAEEVQLSDTVIASGHQLEKTETIAASCTEKGVKEYWTCKREGCGKMFLDEAGTQEVQPEELVIKAGGHQYEAGICKVCGAKDAAFKASVKSSDLNVEVGEDFSITLNADFDTVTGEEWHFYLDGKEINKEFITVSKGSVVFTISSEAIQTLKPGNYPIKVTTSQGDVDAILTVSASYDVNITATKNGTVTASKTTAAEGDTITLTVKPDSGYILDELSVLDASNNGITVTDNKFTMPAKNVTVTATFKKTYKVIFDTVLPVKISNVPPNQEIASGEKVSKPTDPSDSTQHHKFQEWYKDASYKTAFNFSKDTITEDTTLYAKWSHPYSGGICQYCWEAKPDFREVVDPNYEPIIIQGIKGEKGRYWTAHYGSTHTFVIDSYYPYVAKGSVTVKIGGRGVIKYGSAYDLYGNKTSGNTIVTLSRDYIKSLPVGEYSVQIITNLGTASGVFRVSSSPKTGDNSNVALWVTVGVISAAGVAGIAYYLLKKRKK